MPENLNLDSFLFGGDYSPEQWSPDVWDKDIELMQLLGVNAVTLNVHSWIFDEPSEGVFDFSWLDDIITKLKKAGIGIIMATGTTAPPSWLYNKDENILKTDIKGRKLKYGVRERFCPTSETYIYAIKKLVSKLAEHYAAEKSILLWHLNNELSGFCYCEHCEKEFRKWLKAKYGDIETLNRRWCTAMWGRCYTSFDDIVAPTELNELYVNVNGEGFDLDSLPTEAIEYARFMSDCCENLFTVESECIKKYIPNAVCTNNYQFRDRFNYHTIAKALDVISLDIYPNRNDPPYESCFNLDIARNFKGQDNPFIIMEMTPNHASWAYVCHTKRPGEVARIAVNNIAHGANSALFFQIRRTPAGFEKFHGAMISHAGHLDTRIARELQYLSSDLKKLPLDIQAYGLDAKVAIIHDWDEKLGVEIPCSVQKNIDYTREVKHYYRYFNERNINIDVISLDQDFSRYTVIVAPVVCMLRREYAEALDSFVRNGGCLVLTYYSGYTDECDYMYLGGQPGPLRQVAGLWVEEIDALGKNENNIMLFSDGYSCKSGWMCDVIRLDNAKPLAYYGNDYYKGSPCLTENNYGKGRCFYIGTKPENEGVDHILDMVMKEAGIVPVMETPENVSAVKRGPYLFLINFSEEEKTVELPNIMHDILKNEDTCAVSLKANGYAVMK